VFLKSKAVKNPPANGEVEATQTSTAPNGHQAADEAAAPPYLPGVLLHRMLRSQHLVSAGQQTSYENEAWAPELPGGLFRRRRAITEEQSSSAAGTQ